MITLKQNDNGVGFRATLSNNNEKVNLTDAEVTFLMDEFEIPAVVEDALNGVVSVYFERIHTEKARLFKGEFEVKFLDERNETFPNDGYIKINILKHVGGY